MNQVSQPEPRRSNRVTRVGLRTLRLKPKVVGETSDGDPIVEVRSVRLVLRPNASHFNRIVACTKCGREVTGSSVLSVNDLNHTQQPLICNACVRSVGPLYEAVAASAGSPETRVERAPTQNKDGGGHAEWQPTADARLAALEQRISEVADLLGGRLAASEEAVEEQLQSTRAELATLAAESREGGQAQQHVDVVVTAVLERLGGSTDINAGRVDALERRMDEALRTLTARLEAHRPELTTALEARLGQLQTTLQGEVSQVRGSVAHVSRGNEVLGRTQREIERRLATVSEGLAEAAASSRDGLKAVDGLARQLEDALQSLTSRADKQRSDLWTAVEGRVQELQAAFGNDLARVSSAVADLGSGNVQLGRAQEHMGLRLESLSERMAAEAATERDRLRALEGRVQQLQASVDAQAAGSRSTSVMAERANEELARIEMQLNERLDRRTEREARGADLHDQRLRAVEAQVLDAARRLAEKAASERVELQNELRDALVEVRAEVSDAAARGDSRLQALEARVERGDAEISELGSLQALLDGGFGELRAGVAAVRGATNELAASQRELDARLDAVGGAPPAAKADRGWLRRSDRKSGEGDFQPDEFSAGTAELLLQLRELQDRLDRLEDVANAATAAAARASSRTEAAAPLRSDLRAMQDRMTAQDEALAKLSRSVDRLRRRLPPQDSAKQAPKPTRG